MSQIAPRKIEVEELPVDEETESFRQVRLVERRTTGSEVNLGVQWYRPGGEPIRWSADKKTHEVFYVSHGKVRVSWEGPDKGSEELATGDGFFLAPAHDYAVEAAGGHPAVVIWAVAPAQT